jgi:hypothetical protein
MAWQGLRTAVELLANFLPPPQHRHDNWFIAWCSSTIRSDTQHVHEWHQWDSSHTWPPSETVFVNISPVSEITFWQSYMIPLMLFMPFTDLFGTWGFCQRSSPAIQWLFACYCSSVRANVDFAILAFEPLIVSRTFLMVWRILSII